MPDALFYAAVWVNGAIVGAVGTAVYLWWRVVRARDRSTDRGFSGKVTR